MSAVEAYPLSHFTSEHFEGGFEFFNGKTNMSVSMNDFAEGLPEFLDRADLFLYSQGLWDELPEDFLQYTDEEKAFNVVNNILINWNNKQED